MYFEIVHKFINNNCIHEILIHENKKDIKYKHKYVFLCNSNEYSKFDNISEKVNDNYIDLYSYEYAPETDYIIVFRFYENSINQMNIFTNYDEAIRFFDSMIMHPIYNEICVIEKDRDRNIMHTLYYKIDGVYIIPEKVHRIVLLKCSVHDTKLVI